MTIRHTLPICDRPDRIGARVFLRVSGMAAECPCCSFWRGVVAGVIAMLLAGLIAGALHA